MDRRAFIVSGVAALACMPVAGSALPAARKLGILWYGNREVFDAEVGLRFLSNLKEAGWVAGRNLEVLQRFGAFGDSPALARNLVDLRPDAILTRGTPGARALQQATRTIPIVADVGDPVGSGFAKMLSRPGGNITGISQGATESIPKALGLLKRLVPGLSRVGVIFMASYPFAREIASQYRSAVRETGAECETFIVEGREEIESAVRETAKHRGAAILLGNVGPEAAGIIGEVALRHRIATLSQRGLAVGEGALMSYRMYFADRAGRLAVLVGKVLRGADPAGIPFELPDRSELQINRRTAAALGIALPVDLVMLADEVFD